MESVSLEKTAYRVVQALKHKDWNTFRRECTPTIAFHEYRRARPQEYPKGLYEYAFRGGFLSSDAEGDQMTFVGWSVDVSRSLSKGDRHLFHLFCGLLERNRFPDPGVSGVDTIEVDEDLDDGDEARFLHGPAITGRIASNAEWRIEMEWYRQKWKVRRLIVASH